MGSEMCIRDSCKACGAMTVGWTIHEQDYEKAKRMYDAIIFEGFEPPVKY